MDVHWPGVANRKPTCVGVAAVRRKRRGSIQLLGPVWSFASDSYLWDAPTSREDSTVQVPAGPLVISDAASQKLGTSWLMMNWLRARARMVMLILPVGTC